MSTTVFYAWQSDRPPKENRYFIRDALNEAIKLLCARSRGKEAGDGTEVQDSERPEEDEEIELDHDTKGVPGSPPIAEVIQAKIKKCSAFVADVTMVGGTESGSKSLPNPNVMIELGMAFEAKTWGRVVLVMNTVYGGRDKLPFDLQHKREPVMFQCREEDDRKAKVLELAKLLADRLQGMLKEPEPVPEPAKDPAEEMRLAVSSNNPVVGQFEYPAP